MIVGLIGTGTMGKGIAQILAQADLIDQILWLGRNPAPAQTAQHDVEQRIKKLEEKNRISSDAAQKAIKKIVIIEHIEQLATAKTIIEAVAENIESKKSVFSKISSIADESTIIASNTSSLSITQLASLTKHPENVIGLHFFNPPTVMKLTEVVIGLTTSPTTTEWALDFSKKLGKDPVVVNEAPGFIVNRMLIPMINEAIGILAEGVASAEEIDKAMKLGANHPIGPLALADLIGNDVNLSIMETLHNETGDPKYRAHPLLRKMVRANLLGRKSGQGFFKYTRQ
ncbi:3-hydroxyacyl-CoA dehydrogenase [Kerstersia gyiorum]|jgi:3-hydroxybutyryl-CoA dehydrogenase|uniref:3-hydroxyacyl-CoA dehydrogenase n=1 Tax=Kerstersia gyiorum TaxID=206506 RepID=A0A4Q7MIT7_9BURK|nr:3-hydroxyacyl-CoA dehydrogenase NAD-binding domain-containing protein [Kerstersia gyiorum]KAB0542981.1 3-hydroxybutyryl-CoA dehydrogenase [Kerstersia gyiorum]MCH4272494.1 3-hydroxyacyl-CoA dehydrogenase NAD-binding domain-containing protein [Kerstersia gyiorum]MCI1227703.1 3-hydroxyacyl-CoA dehydrogenase NAD-binding domain-containing protein [Kerstersia gyiorum]RZS67473.1 3-hydroxyacyl-CoA dehydrogenase [Kerstersia gyiorum]